MRMLMSYLQIKYVFWHYLITYSEDHLNLVEIGHQPKILVTNRPSRLKALILGCLIRFPGLAAHLHCYQNGIVP